MRRSRIFERRPHTAHCIKLCGAFGGAIHGVRSMRICIIHSASHIHAKIAAIPAKLNRMWFSDTVCPDDEFLLGAVLELFIMIIYSHSITSNNERTFVNWMSAGEKRTKNLRAMMWQHLMLHPYSTRKDVRTLALTHSHQCLTLCISSDVSV